MPGQIRIPLDEMHEMLGRGKTLKEIADQFGVSYTAVYYARQKLKNSVVRASVVKAHEVLGKTTDVIERLQRSLDGFDNDLEDALDLFQRSASVNEKALVLRARTDIRDKLGKQIGRILEAARLLSDLKVMSEFINEVLNTVERVSPHERERIVRQLETSCGAAIGTFLRFERPVSGSVQADRAEDVSGGCPDGSGSGFGDPGVPEDPS